jgi:SNF2 family DNA or RNA helicase
MTYEHLVRIMDEWKKGDTLPEGVIFDESTRLKTPTSQRSKAARKLTDLLREKYMWDAYAILMSGTPSPKKPTDWWSQCEITWPGFLREGSVKALEQRLAFQVQKRFDSGTFWQTIGWRDDPDKCAMCGDTLEEGQHELDPYGDEEDYHKFQASKNEVSFMFERLKGLVVIKHKSDCLTLPEKRYRTVECKPSKSLLRLAKTVVESSPNAMTSMTKLRELSDGFQYRDVDDGMKPCDHCGASGKINEWFDPDDTNRTFQAIDMLDEDLVARLEKHQVECPKCHGTCEIKKTKRITKRVPCPKEAALKGLLGECEETGRIVIFAGFTGSVDRCVEICHNEGWSVVRCDGRGFQVTLSDGTTITDVEALDFWADLEANPNVAFVAHPESGGMSLTLVEARMAVYWSNSFKPEYRVQSEDRIHRKGMDENLGCCIVDLLHLPTDERVVEIIRENRKLELMTMGKITEGIDWNTGEDES